MCYLPWDATALERYKFGIQCHKPGFMAQIYKVLSGCAAVLSTDHAGRGFARRVAIPSIADPIDIARASSRCRGRTLCRL
jgi:hypothetical protein